MHFLFEILMNLKYLVGFVQSGTFREKLSDEEENEYVALLFQEETREYARKELIERNLRLVAHIAKKYEDPLDAQEDLISIGTIGLIKAVDTYSKEKQVRLATYAARCIENEILMTLRSHKRYSKDVSLSDTIGVDKDGTEMTLLDVYPAEQEDIPDEIEKNTQLLKLSKYLKVLTPREYEILRLRYGLENVEELTQREISKKYKISRSYVSRIEKRALTKLLQEFRKHQ